MAEISNQSDEGSKSSPISVIYNVCDNDESVCCDVESFMTSLAEDLKAGDSDFVESTNDVETLGESGTLVTSDNYDACDSENSEGGHEEESAGDGESYLKAEGCLNNSSSSTEEQSKNVQRSHQGECSGSQQPHETESRAQVKSGTSNSAETFNTFQYWRIPVPELQLEIGLAETVGHEVVPAVETAQYTAESRLVVDMDIDVSSLPGLPYIIFLPLKVFNFTLSVGNYVVRMMKWSITNFIIIVEYSCNNAVEYSCNNGVEYSCNNGVEYSCNNGVEYSCNNGVEYSCNNGVEYTSAVG
jgi:hypothetical protein